jgi:MoxR-like ATPase
MNTQFTPDEFRNTANGLIDECGKLVVGNREILKLIVTAMVADGHCLLQSVPGLGKTIIGNALGAALKDGNWGFFPFTADLLPSDVKGSEIYNEAKRAMDIKYGAIHPEYNIFVADEINRATPKTAGSLLAIMEERKIVIGDQTFLMADPSIVIGTQNPIEQEGTYPLPEAMLDRFAVMGRLDYLSNEDECKLAKKDSIFDRDPQKASGIAPVITPAQVIAMRNFVRREVKFSDSMVQYLVNLIRTTRPDSEEFNKWMPARFSKVLTIGGSQRTTKWLVICSKAAAALRGSDIVQAEDIQTMLLPCVGHKLCLSPDVKARQNTDHVEEEILAAVIENVPVAG